MPDAEPDREVRQLQGELAALLSPRYTIEKHLKTGGAGAVFVVTDNSNQVERVVKALRPGARQIKALKDEFLDEAKKLGRLRHPNLVTVYEQSPSDDTPYFIMEFVGGETLDNAVQGLAKESATGTWVYAVRKILLQLADALAYLHSQPRPLLHLDVKPENVHLLYDYRNKPIPILLDFGISRYAEYNASAASSPETEAFGTFWMWPKKYQDKVLKMTDPGRTLYKIDRSLLNAELDLHLLGKTLEKILDAGQKESGSTSSWDPMARSELHFLRGLVKQLDIDDPVTPKFTAVELRKAIRRLELRASRARYRLDAGLVRIPGKTITNYGDKARSLTDWPRFQRLRGIRQLGLGYLVYPGATHTRFEHSLGVFDNALTVLDHLAGPQGDHRFRSLVSDEELLGTAIVALLHDIGHYPLGHDFRAEQDIPVHEERTLQLLESEEARGRIQGNFGSDVYNFVIRLMRNVVAHECPKIKDTSESSDPSYMGVLRKIISSNIDVDKLDYLSRDSLHAGVPYGNVVDRDRFLVSLRIWWDKDGTPYLVLSDKGRVCAEALVFARYLMTSEVYWNHGVRAFTAMVAAAIHQFDKEEIQPHLWDTDPEFLAWLARDNRSSWLQGLIDERKPYRRAFVLQKLGGKELDVETDHALFEFLQSAVTTQQDLLPKILEEVARALGLREPLKHEIVLDIPRGTTRVGGVQVLPEGREEPGSVGPIFDAIGENFDGFGRKARIFIHPRLMEGRSVAESTLLVRKALVTAFRLA
jgi:HD superfamily phosphohydrolase